MARVPYATQAELDGEDRELIVSSLQPGEELNVYSAIATNLAVLRGLREYLGALWTDSGLSDREREIVILSTAAELGSAYEFHQHVAIAVSAELTAEEVAAIGRDDRSPFAPAQAGLAAYARAVVRGGVEDPLHEALTEHYDDRAIVGAAATAAGYLALARIIDALGVELEAGDSFVGWDPR